MLLIPLLVFVLFLISYLVVAECDDELDQARQPTQFLLAFFLLCAFAFATYPYLSLWMQLVGEAVFLLLFLKRPVLSLYRWTAGGLAILVWMAHSLWGLAGILLATIAATVLLAGAENGTHSHLSRLVASAKWSFLPMLVSALITCLPFLLSKL